MLLNSFTFTYDLFVKTTHDTFLLETLTDPCEISFHMTTNYVPLSRMIFLAALPQGT